MKNDATVSIDRKLYEAPTKYICSKINIRYDPTNDAEAYIFNENRKRLKWILKANKIDRTNHEALRQRISVNYHFEGLNNNEIKDYITSRLILYILFLYVNFCLYISLFYLKSLQKLILTFLALLNSSQFQIQLL